MTEAIEEDTVRLLLHVQIEQKIEREQVAKVTGTNKDDSVAKAPVRRETKKIQRTIFTHLQVRMFRLIITYQKDSG